MQLWQRCSWCQWGWNIIDGLTKLLEFYLCWGPCESPWAWEFKRSLVSISLMLQLIWICIIHYDDHLSSILLALLFPKFSAYLVLRIAISLHGCVMMPFYTFLNCSNHHALFLRAESQKWPSHISAPPVWFRLVYDCAMVYSDPCWHMLISMAILVLDYQELIYIYDLLVNSRYISQWVINIFALVSYVIFAGWLIISRKCFSTIMILLLIVNWN